MIDQQRPCRFFWQGLLRIPTSILDGDSRMHTTNPSPPPDSSSRPSELEVPPTSLASPLEPPTNSTPTPDCDRCGREDRYCVCAFTTPLTTSIKVLILQHPQEPGVDIGTVPIISTLFPETTVRTGLSWPNFTKALGEAADHKRWGVLYMGSVHVENLPKDRNLFVVDKKGEVVANQDATLCELEGIVVLDGTWSQAKTLWWRNAWLLKLPRIVLKPTRQPLYDKIRKEPRKGCLSTLETIGETISILERRDDIDAAVRAPLTELVDRLQKGRKRGSPQRGRRDWRRRGHHRP
jgi:DTW domain-containing protein YfiP